MRCALTNCDVAVREKAVKQLATSLLSCQQTQINHIRASLYPFLAHHPDVSHPFFWW
jgi:hypothetical protein